jgi:hypothetical protein
MSISGLPEIDRAIPISGGAAGEVMGIARAPIVFDGRAE